MTAHGQQFITNLETAKSLFEAALDASGPAKLAALDSMLFECSRARRIARDAPEMVRNVGIDPDEFNGVMDDVAAHRNVIEHWADVIKPRKPKMHKRTTPGGLKIAVDETSWILVGPKEIYKGRLNLYDVYVYLIAKLGQAKPARE